MLCGGEGSLRPAVEAEVARFLHAGSLCAFRCNQRTESYEKTSLTKEPLFMIHKYLSNKDLVVQLGFIVSHERKR